MALAPLCRRRSRLTPDEAAVTLARFLAHERGAVVRRWRLLLRQAALYDGDEFTRELAPLVEELERLLGEPADEVRALFAAHVAGRGRARYLAQHRLRDTERELGLLHQAIMQSWGEREGDVPAAVAMLLGAIVGEGMVRVASEYARAGEAAEARLRLATLWPALAHLGEVLVVLDRRGQVAMAAGPIEALLGRPPAELVGQAPRPDSPAERALRSGRAVPPERVRLRHAHSGEERTFEARAYPLRQDEQLVGAVELLRDVTEDIERDEELGRADRELKALHGRLLRRAHNQALAELAASSASALNNELNAIGMTLTLLGRDLGDAAGDGAVARHLGAIEAAVGRAAALLARLAQLAARPADAPVRAVALNPAVLEALDLVRPELATATARPAVRVDARLGQVGAVAAQAAELRELLCSLLIEARDSLDRGGVLTLATATEARHGVVLLGHAARGGDDDAFAPTSERGVTLSAARERARRWGGDLETERRGGRLELRLRLPLAAAPAHQAAPAPPLHARARRVLVVDDDAGNRETLTELLTLSGHHVTAAASAADALEAVHHGGRDAFDVALVDLAMPDMNGIELARRLRRHAPGLRIALVTGWEPSAVSDSGGDIETVFRKPLDWPAMQRFLDVEAPADAH